MGTGRGAQLGILIKGPQILESTRRIDTVVLDKTGTVTTGRMSVTSMHVAEGESDTEVLRLAGALERRVRTPHRAGGGRPRGGCAGPLPAVTDFENHGGSGCHRCRRRSHRRRRAFGLAGAERRARRAAPSRRSGRGRRPYPGLVRGRRRIRAVIVVADTIKQSSATAVAELRELGLDRYCSPGTTVARRKRSRASSGSTR